MILTIQKLFLIGVFMFLCDSPAFTQWIQTYDRDFADIREFELDGTKIFAAAYNPGLPFDNVLVSTDDGSTWADASYGITFHYVISISTNGVALLAGTHGGGVFRSIDGGQNWTASSTGLTSSEPYLSISELTSNDEGDFFASVYRGGIFRSTNDGLNWTPASGGLSDTLFVRDLVSSSGTLLAGTSQAGIFRSTDNGSSWTRTNDGLTDSIVYCFTIKGTTIFAGSHAHVFFSDDDGETWSTTGWIWADTIHVISLASTPTALFCVTQIRDSTGAVLGGGDVFVSTDDGSSWTVVSSGLGDDSPGVVATADTNLLVGAYDGIWKRRISEIVLSVSDSLPSLPVNYRLDQNYPNPFNSMTNIRYELDHRTHVNLEIITPLGQVVAVPVEEDQSAGIHQISVNATSLASGVYFYRLSTDSFVETRKMILLR